MSEEAWGGLAVLAVIAFVLWLFVPRAGYWDDAAISYAVRSTHCNEHLFCDVQQGDALEPVKLRVDSQRAEVVWFDASSNEINRFSGCAILDKANWTCDDGTHMMREAIMQDNFEDLAANIHHMAGYMWRLNWLGSLVNPRKQDGGWVNLGGGVRIREKP